MPTYEYVCEKCGHQFEVSQSISAAPLEVCPEDTCARKRWGKGRVRRAISGGAGLLFKGTGFYITDYRSENYKKAAKKDAPTASGGDSKSSSTAASTTPAPAKPSSEKKKAASPP